MVKLSDELCDCGTVETMLDKTFDLVRFMDDTHCPGYNIMILTVALQIFGNMMYRRMVEEHADCDIPFGLVSNMVIDQAKDAESIVAGCGRKKVGMFVQSITNEAKKETMQ